MPPRSPTNGLSSAAFRSLTGAAGTLPAKCRSHSSVARVDSVPSSSRFTSSRLASRSLKLRKRASFAPFRPAQAFAQDRPEFLLVAHDEDKAVRGAVELARHQRGMAGARFAALHMPRFRYQV